MQDRCYRRMLKKGKVIGCYYSVAAGKGKGFRESDALPTNAISLAEGSTGFHVSNTVVTALCQA